MKQLIKEEFKKILKKKYFLVLFILLLGFSAYTTYNNYSSMYTGNNVIKNDKNEELSGIAALRYIDNKRHEYAGTISEESVNKFVNDYEKAINQFDIEHLTIDNEKMEAVYGKKYEELNEKAKANQLNNSEQEKLNELMEYWVNYDLDNNSFELEKFYIEESVFKGVFSIYDSVNEFFNVYNFFSLYDSEVESGNYAEFSLQQVQSKFLPLLHKKDYKIKVHPMDPNFKSEDYKSVLDVYYEMHLDSEIIEYYNQRFLEIEPYYDSTLPNQFLINNMSHPLVLVLSLLLITIVLADIFSYDRQTKSDQIIDSTILGKRKLKVAKLLVGITTALGIVFLQQIIITLISHIILPIRDLSLVELGYDSIGYEVVHITRYLESYQNVIISGIIMIPLAALVISMLTMVISYISKNKFITSIIMILGILIAVILVDSSRTIFQSYLPFIPTTFMRFTLFHNFIEYSTSGMITHTVLMGNVVAWRDISIIFWLVASAAMFIFISFVRVGEVKNK